MQHTTYTDFTESLTHLRQALVDADPLTLAEPGPVETQAQRVEALFTEASEDERERLLLRALDDAIASIEIAAQLADELHARRHDLGAESDEPERMDDERSRLRTAYLAFVESQTQWQALYQYRNVLAARLQEMARVAPERVDSSVPEHETSGTAARPATKPRRRGKTGRELPVKRG